MKPSGEMKASDATKKSLLIAFATALFILAVLAPFHIRAPLAQGSISSPAVPLGTDQLKIGVNLYLSNGYHFGKVVKIDQQHAFPDGTKGAGALVKPTNAFRVWIPMDKLMNALVVQ